MSHISRGRARMEEIGWRAKLTHGKNEWFTVDWLLVKSIGKNWIWSYSWDNGAALNDHLDGKWMVTLVEIPILTLVLHRRSVFFGTKQSYLIDVWASINASVLVRSLANNEKMQQDCSRSDDQMKRKTRQSVRRINWIHWFHIWRNHLEQESLQSSVKRLIAFLSITPEKNVSCDLYLICFFIFYFLQLREAQEFPSRFIKQLGFSTLNQHLAGSSFIYP